MQSPEQTNCVPSTEIFPQPLVQQEYTPSSTKTILVRRKTETQPEITMDVPEFIHPSLVEPYLIKAMQKGIFETSEETWRLMGSIVGQQKDDSFKRALELILRSNTPPRSILAYELDCPELTPASRALIYTLLQGKRVKYQTPIYWSPPSFDAVQEYCDELCDSRQNIIPLGTMHGIEIQGNFCGRVTCWGDEGDDFGGSGLLKFVEDGKEVEIAVQVLGSIDCTGTALLLDEAGNMWCYNTPNAADRHFSLLKHQAAILLKSGDVAGVSQSLRFEKTVPFAQVETQQDDYDVYFS